MRIRLLICLLAGALLSSPHSLSAQSRTTSAVHVTLSLPNSDPAVGATVILRDTRVGTRLSMPTNAQGEALFLGLRPGGPWQLTASMIGHSGINFEALELGVGSTIRVREVFQTTAVSVTGVTVTSAQSSTFDFSGGGPVTRLGQQEIRDLPLLSRDLVELSLLSPMVSRTESGGFSFAGQNDRYNSLLVDGTRAGDPFGLTAGGVPGGQAGAKLLPFDAVSQFEILTAPYDVRLSGFTGGIMNAVTHSGTNDFQSRTFATYRNPTFGGPLRLETGSAGGSDVSQIVVGASAGGALIRNQAHYFVAAEFEHLQRPPQGYNLGRDDPLLFRLGTAELNEAVEGIRSFIGEDPGEPGVIDLNRSLVNVFGRVDWQLDPTNRLVVRNNFAFAGDDDGPNRLGFDPYGLSSNTVRRTGWTNGLTAELVTALDDRTSNELTATYQKGVDESTPAVDWPQIDVEVFSSVEERAVTRTIRAGARLTAQDNSLRRSEFRLTDNLTRSSGPWILTVGATAARYHFEQSYLPGAIGQFRFSSVDDLLDRDPIEFRHSQISSLEDPTVPFSVLEVGTLAQAELKVGSGLTMRLGMRADVPFVRATVLRDERVADEFGYDNTQLPSGKVQISPRFSFSYLHQGETRTRLRGGAGLFVGQTPFVWVADALQNSGLRVLEDRCASARIYEDRYTCGIPGRSPPNVTVFDPDFRYPQDFRASIGIDHELTERITFSASGMYNRAMSQLALQELNLGTPTDVGPTRGYGDDLREYFGNGSGGYPWFNPVPRVAGYRQVLLATNASEDWAVVGTAELAFRFSEYRLRTGYTFTRSRDRMSLIATDMASNFGFAPAGIHPNLQPLSSSNFERPHRVVASLAAAPFGDDGVRFSVLYTGQSGVPFSYVYNADLNGDGYPGHGATFERTNDLFYVPVNASELPLSPASIGLVQAGIDGTPCLAEARGTILKRNTCRSPWQHSLDLRVSRALSVGARRLRIDLDLVNALNLVNSSWGQTQTLSAVVPVVEVYNRSERIGELGPLFSRWAGATYRADDGRIVPTPPWTPAPERSVWQIQLGAHLELGGG